MPNKRFKALCNGIKHVTTACKIFGQSNGYDIVRRTLINKNYHGKFHKTADIIPAVGPYDGRL